MEESVLTKRNVIESNRDQTQSWSSTMFGLDRVRKAAMLDKKQQFTGLLHHLTPELLKLSFYRLKRDAAKGVDGLGWIDIEQDLESRIKDLNQRIHSGCYKPKPSRRIYIPKDDGTQRPLSIQSIEDKIVQHAVVNLLNQIYEVDFLGFSYGFRPGRSQHNALDALSVGIAKRKVNWVLDLDIQRFFDTVDHEWLIQMIRHRVKDERLITLIIKWIKVGIVDEKGKRVAAIQGVPQGAVISPLLANIYLHYVFDQWSHQWRRKDAKGEVLIIRYADDSVLCFQYESEARHFLTLLKQRLQNFGLTLHPDKTRLIRFGRFAVSQGTDLGLRKTETFDFLGFTHFCSTKRNGEYRVGRKTSRKRLRKQIKRIQIELRKRMHHKVGVTLKWLQQVIRGHLNYYGVPGNSKMLNLFRSEIIKRWLKMLRRRSQRHKIIWAKFTPWINRHLPNTRIVHLYPEQRFHARYSK